LRFGCILVHKLEKCGTLVQQLVFRVQFGTQPIRAQHMDTPAWKRARASLLAFLHGAPCRLSNSALRPCLVEPHQNARTSSSLGFSSISATQFLHQRRCTTSIGGSWRREDDDGVGDAMQMANQPRLWLWNEDPPEYCKPPLFSSSFFLLCFPPPWLCAPILRRWLG
jgi:hypothetical protein